MYELIEHKKLDSAAASITFSNIPQIYTDLYLVVSGRTARTVTTTDTILLKFNDSSANFTHKRLEGDGSTRYSAGNSQSYSGLASNSSSTANTFGNTKIYIPNYTSAAYKSYSTDGVSEHNGTEAYQTITAGLWSVTDAITSVTLYTDSGLNWLQYSSATLYGVGRNTPRGNPKATGGTVSYANGHWFHTFTGSGTFYAREDLQIDALVVGGGGGGGSGPNFSSNGGGGGGAGGYLTAVQRTITAGSYPVAVGAGGARSEFPASSSLTAFSGSNSYFAELLSYGGGGAGTGNIQGLSGGSGGGSSGTIPPSYTTGQPGGAGTTGQGYAGGTGSASQGGGGGGAGGVGGNSSNGSNTGGAGGIGSQWINGLYYAGGGGGGAYSSGTAGTGGSGVGGNGGSSPTSGATNTGSGGGGANGYSGSYGGNGSSGVVIIRYRAD